MDPKHEDTPGKPALMPVLRCTLRYIFNGGSKKPRNKQANPWYNGVAPARVDKKHSLLRGPSSRLIQEAEQAWAVCARV